MNEGLRRELAIAELFTHAWFLAVARLPLSETTPHIHTVLTHIGGMEIMARGKGKLPRIDERADWQTQFVTVNLNGVSMQRIQDAVPDEDALWDGFTSLIEDGYKIGFVYNGKNQAVICSLTCKDEQSPNFNKTMSSFAATWQDALRVALYKHYVHTETDWTKGGENGSTPTFG